MTFKALFFLLLANIVDCFDGEVFKYSLNIDLTPFYVDHDDIFNGHVRIHLKLHKPSNELVLDAENLKILLIKVNNTVVKGSLKEKKVHINGQFKNADYFLDIEYSGIINNHKTGGLYKVLYKKNTKALLATHLEPEKARAIFPCFDDPNLKAKFQLSITLPKGLTSFSNTEISSRSSVSDRLEKVLFDETLSMSTFLFALVVGEFRVKKVKYKKRVDLRVATVIENKELLDKIMKYAVDCLESMEEYTQVEYPMNKLDHIDVLRMPTLAMQNFGLITYSNSFGITSDLEIKEELEQRRLVCHETAHQWFSNIITTNDWGQIFLHEGFATYFEDIVFKTSTNDEKIALETKIIQNFQEGIQEKLFNAHPIISNKFISDETVYLSAGAVIQMIENVIGREKFRNSLKILIKEHFLGNFDYNDVIRSFEKVAGPNLCGKEVTTRNFISQFLHSKDVPVVKVQKSPSKYILSQISREKYTVPLFISNGWNETLVWLLPDNSVCHPDANSTDILITNQTLAFNYKYQSFARFEYDHNVYSRYLKSIHKMDDVTVFNILMDFRENLGTEMFIDLAAAAVQTKRTSLVWKVVVDYVYEKFDDVSIQKPLKKPIRRLERHFLWKESSNSVIRQLQNEVSYFLVDAEVGEAVEKAYKLFQTNFSSCKSNLWSCNRIPADLRPAVYCAAIKSESKNLKFLKNYQKSFSQISLIPQAFESELSAIDYAFNCQ